jgi:hypothetical protein
MDKKKIVVIGGFGRSGTGAIHQLLRSHYRIYALPNYEFRLLTDPDGLINLKYSLVNNWNVFQTDFAIQRFISLANNLGDYWSGPYVFSTHSKEMGKSYFDALNDFLTNLKISKYKGLWAGKSNFINKIIMKLTNHNKYFINKYIYYCPNVTSSEFCAFSNKYINAMHADVLNRNENDIILLNEPNATQNILEVSKLTKSKHFIIVYRDPRDAFASFITKDWSPHNIEEATNFLKLVYERWFIQKELIDKKYLLEIKLEDLVNNTSDTIKSIENFLQINIDKNMVLKSNYSPEKAHVGRWETEFTSLEKEKINSSFSGILAKTGYK